MSEARSKMLKFIEKANASLKRKHKENVLYLASECGDFQPLPSGFPTIDWINSGIGGYPRGGMTLIHGLESTGKSTLTLECIRHNQQHDPEFTAMFIDVESALTKDFLKFKGIDPERVALTPLNACEDVLTVAKNAIAENIFDVVVIDSLAKLDSEKILEKDIGEAAQRNRRAVLITEFLRSISFILRKSKTALICINQEVQNQDPSPYAPKTILPCGMQQKFSANLRLEIKRTKSIKDGDIKVGYQMEMTSKKNKISDKENAKSKMTYLYDRGFIKAISYVEFLMAIGLVRKLTAGRFEFVKKEFCSEVFKPKDIINIVEQIKSNLNIDLVGSKPTEIQFDKDENPNDEHLGTDNISESDD